MSPTEVELYPTYFCSRWSKISDSGMASQLPMARIDGRIIWLVLDCQNEGKLYIFGFGACLLWTHCYKHIIEIIILYMIEGLCSEHTSNLKCQWCTDVRIVGGDTKHRDSKMVTASASKKMLGTTKKAFAAISKCNMRKLIFVGISFLLKKEMGSCYSRLSKSKAARRR